MEGDGVAAPEWCDGPHEQAATGVKAADRERHLQVLVHIGHGGWARVRDAGKDILFGKILVGVDIAVVLTTSQPEILRSICFITNHWDRCASVWSQWY